MREVVQRGLYYDELETGVVYRHRPGRTLTEADDVVFSTLTMNHQALHLDAAWAATQPFGQRLVNSMMTLSTLVGLSVGQVTQGTIVANLGFREVEFPKPLFHGDTLYAETEVVEKRLSASRPGQGVVTLEHRGLNQDGVLVAEHDPRQDRDDRCSAQAQQRRVPADMHGSERRIADVGGPGFGDRFERLLAHLDTDH